MLAYLFILYVPFTILIGVGVIEGEVVLVLADLRTLLKGARGY